MSGSSSLKKKYAVNHEHKYCSEVFKFSGIDFEIDQKKCGGSVRTPQTWGPHCFWKKCRKINFLTHCSHLVFYYQFQIHGNKQIQAERITKHTNFLKIRFL